MEKGSGAWVVLKVLGVFSAWIEITLLIFVILKLTDVLGWSWWGVLAPLWITLVFLKVAGVLWFVDEVRAALGNRRRFNALYEEFDRDR